MFNFLIIDDDSSRENALKNIFNHESFKIELIFNKSDFFAKDGSFEQYDCIACDISLDNWIDGGDITNMFDTVLKTIGKNTPIIIYSSVIEDIIVWTNKIIEEKYPLIYTIALQEGTHEKNTRKKLCSIESNQIICNNVFTLLQRKNSFGSLKKDPNEDLNILHISDLQFGDPAFNENLSETFESSLRRAISMGVVPKIDFIAISGDISFSGKPSQFDEAHKWISNLSTSVIGKNFQDRLLLTPGNHDANLSICALNHYSYHFPSKNEQEGNIIFDKIEKNNDYSFYAMDPFRDFAYKLTKDLNWLDNTSMSFINYKHCYLGLKFIHLNSIIPQSQLGKNDAIFHLNGSTISTLRNCKKRNNKYIDLPTIILTHPSPKHYGYDLDEEHIDNWTSISNFFIEMNASLYIYGHRHKNLKTTEIPLNTEKNIEISGTGTLLCKPDDGDRRGFKVIKLNRQDGNISDISIKSFDYKNDGTIKPE